MRQLKTIGMFGLLLLAAGCSNASRLDATNEETLKRSMEAMQTGMSEQQKKEFVGDCMTVVLPDAMKNAFQGAFNMDKKADPMNGAQLFKSLHGLTAAEIHKKAADVRGQMGAKKN